MKLTFFFIHIIAVTIIVIMFILYTTLHGFFLFSFFVGDESRDPFACHDRLPVNSFLPSCPAVWICSS